MVDWALGLENVLMFGFGPDVAKGFIPGLLKKLSVEKCRQYILEDRSLLSGVNPDHWKLIRKAARAAKLTLSYDEVIAQLATNRPDILATLCTTEGGVEWLNRQVEEAQKKMVG